MMRVWGQQRANDAEILKPHMYLQRDWMLWGSRCVPHECGLYVCIVAFSHNHHYMELIAMRNHSLLTQVPLKAC